MAFENYDVDFIKKGVDVSIRKRLSMEEAEL